MNTGQNVDPWLLDNKESPHWKHGLGYRPSPVNTFRQIIQSLPIRYEDHEFVDIGSGKGRTLLLAAEYPFRRITGVEYARDLHKMAVKNLVYLKSRSADDRRVSCLCMDATEYPIPEAPAVLYMHNPFRQVVMNKFLANVQASLTNNPRDSLIVVYYNPTCRRLFDESAYFSLLAEPTEKLCVYRSKPLTVSP